MAISAADKERALFDQAVELPTAMRAQFLDENCADDPSLRKRLGRLLRASDEAEEALSTLVPLLPEHPETPESIGPYRVLQPIGQGGMGVVYLAEQSQPVRRRVAVKIIKLGMDTREVIARFNSERQALALMNHPNIARILDAGATEKGRPYFVMEYVPGIVLTDYCDKLRLSIEARLRLFCQVCRAVQHAHQKGVIHRDLKPSNILVLEEDGEPAPRIIDFGVAKATHQRLSELTMHTRFGLLIGTPAYMSPEQAEMSGLDIDTRSDVYSLGAVLYELLVGARPIAELDGTEGAYGDLQRIIRTVDPATPSARLTALGAAAEQCANNRAATVTALRSRLQGELEWIVLKALAKNPARRYQTALGMAEDIENHLAGRPVTAARDSFVYRARKFVRRHRTAFSAAAVVFIALVGGMLAATAGLLQASRERDAAEQARLEAESVTGFFTDMLAAVDPERQGRDVPVRVVLDEAARTIDDKFDGAPLTEARLLGTIGETYRALGRFDEAERHLRRRLALVEDHLPALHPDRLDAMHELGRVLQRQARHEEAEALFEKALQGRREVLGERHWQTLSSASNLAIIYNFQHRHPEAVAVLRELLAIETAMVGENDPRVLSTMHNLGTTLYKSGHVEEATTLLNTAVSGRERLLGLDHPGTIISKIVLGELYKLTGRNEEALRLLGEAVDAGSRSLGPDHPRTLLARHRLGSAVATAGDYAAGEQLLQQTLAARQAVLGPDHLETLITEAELGRVLWLQAKPEARDHLERAVERGAEQLPADDLHLARFRVFLAEQQAAVGQAESAEALLLRAHKAIGDETATLGPEARWVRNRLLETLAGLFEAQGRMQQASQYRSLLVAKD